MAIYVDPKRTSRSSFDPLEVWMKQLEDRQEDEQDASGDQTVDTVNEEEQQDQQPDDIAAEIDRQKAEREAQEEQERKDAEQRAKEKTSGIPAYGSIFERIGDVFEANSPQDIAKRKARGLPETYQQQKSQEKDVADRATRLNFAKDEIDARQEYYQRQGVDLRQTVFLNQKYGKAWDKNAKG